MQEGAGSLEQGAARGPVTRTVTQLDCMPGSAAAAPVHHRADTAPCNHLWKKQFSTSQCLFHLRSIQFYEETRSGRLVLLPAAQGAAAIQESPACQWGRGVVAGAG